MDFLTAPSLQPWAHHVTRRTQLTADRSKTLKQGRHGEDDLVSCGTADTQPDQCVLVMVDAYDGRPPEDPLV